MIGSLVQSAGDSWLLFCHTLFAIAGFRQTLWARRNFAGLHVWEKPGLSGFSGSFG